MDLDAYTQRLPHSPRSLDYLAAELIFAVARIYHDKARAGREAWPADLTRDHLAGDVGNVAEITARVAELTAEHHDGTALVFEPWRGDPVRALLLHASHVQQFADYHNPLGHFLAHREARQTWHHLATVTAVIADTDFETVLEQSLQSRRATA